MRGKAKPLNWLTEKLLNGLLVELVEDYNENHPHKGLNMRSPRKYRRLVNKLE